MRALVRGTGVSGSRPWRQGNPPRLPACSTGCRVQIAAPLLQRIGHSVHTQARSSYSAVASGSRLSIAPPSGARPHPSAAAESESAAILRKSQVALTDVLGDNASQLLRLGVQATPPSASSVADSERCSAVLAAIGHPASSRSGASSSTDSTASTAASSRPSRQDIITALRGMTDDHAPLLADVQVALAGAGELDVELGAELLQAMVRLLAVHRAAHLTPLLLPVARATYAHVLIRGIGRGGSRVDAFFSRYVSVLGLCGHLEEAERVVPAIVSRGVWPTSGLLQRLMGAAIDAKQYTRAVAVYAACWELGSAPSPRVKELLLEALVAATAAGQGTAMEAAAVSVDLSASLSAATAAANAAAASNAAASAAHSLLYSNSSGSSSDVEAEAGSASDTTGALEAAQHSLSPQQRLLARYATLLMRPAQLVGAASSGSTSAGGSSGVASVTSSNGGSSSNGSGSMMSSSEASAAAQDRLSSSFLVLRMLVSLGHLDAEGLLFARTWLQDLRATVLVAAAGPSTAVPVFAAGSAAQLQRAYRAAWGGAVRRGHASPRSVEVDKRLNARILSLLQDVFMPALKAASRPGAAAAEAASTASDARGDILNRAEHILQSSVKEGINVSDDMLAAYAACVVLAGKPERLQPALALCAERPSGTTAAAISTALHSVCSPPLAATLYRALPDLVAYGIRPSSALLQQLCRDATRAWVAGQPVSCPRCLSTARVLTRSEQYAATLRKGDTSSASVTAGRPARAGAAAAAAEVEEVQDYEDQSVPMRRGRARAAVVAEEEDDESVPVRKGRRTRSGYTGGSSNASTSPSGSSSTHSTTSTTANPTVEAGASKRSGGTSGGLLLGLPAWARADAPAIRSPSFSSQVRCAGADASAPWYADLWPLYPSKQLEVLDSTGLLSQLPESEFASMAAAAAAGTATTAGAGCAREAWSVWQRMRTLRLNAAHADKALIKQLFRTFVRGGLQLPAWEAYLLLYPRPATGALPTLQQMQALLDAEDAGLVTTTTSSSPAATASATAVTTSAGTAASPSPTDVSALQQQLAERDAIIANLQKELQSVLAAAPPSPTATSAATKPAQAQAPGAAAGMSSLTVAEAAARYSGVARLNAARTAWLPAPTVPRTHVALSLPASWLYTQAGNASSSGGAASLITRRVFERGIARAVVAALFPHLQAAPAAQHVKLIQRHAVVLAPTTSTGSSGSGGGSGSSSVAVVLPLCVPAVMDGTHVTPGSIAYNATLQAGAAALAGVNSLIIRVALKGSNTVAHTCAVALCPAPAAAAPVPPSLAAITAAHDCTAPQGWKVLALPEGSNEQDRESK